MSKDWRNDCWVWVQKAKQRTDSGFAFEKGAIGCYLECYLLAAKRAMKDEYLETGSSSCQMFVDRKN